MRKISLLLALIATISFSAHGETRAQEEVSEQGEQPLFRLSGDVTAGLSYSDIDDTISGVSTRLQLNLRPHESLEAQGRLWLSKRISPSSGGDDDYYGVTQLYLRWHEMAGLPLTFSVGRLPTLEGGVSHLREGIDQARGEFSPFVNLALDGLSLRVAYGEEWPGALSLYYGTLLEEGYEDREMINEDLKIYSLKWDIIDKKDQSLALQATAFTNIRNVPEDSRFPNPFEYDFSFPSPFDPEADTVTGNGYLDSVDLGDIYNSSLLYSAQWRDLRYFISAAWSHTEAKAMDEMGISLLSGSWREPEDQDGYCFYAGMRYDIEPYWSKLGLEFNYGSEYWLTSPEAYGDHLSTRGKVANLYWLIAPPIPASLQPHLETWMLRLSYSHYWYDYSYSGMWLGTPMEIDELAEDPMAAMFYQPIAEEEIYFASLAIYF